VERASELVARPISSISKSALTVVHAVFLPAEPLLGLLPFSFPSYLPLQVPREKEHKQKQKTKKALFGLIGDSRRRRGNKPEQKLNNFFFLSTIYQQQDEWQDA
jgi:hypothetical protein